MDKVFTVSRDHLHLNVHSKDKCLILGDVKWIALPQNKEHMKFQMVKNVDDRPSKCFQ